MKKTLVAFVVAIWALPASAQQMPGTLQSLDTIYRLDGEELVLEAVPTVLPLPDGSMVLPQRDAAELRRFLPTGQELLPALGGKGAGPGEYDLINTLGWKGDSLWVFDGRQNRFTLYPDYGSGEPNTYMGVHADSPPGGVLPNSPLVLPIALRPDGAVLGLLVGPSWPTGDQGEGQTIALVGPDQKTQRVVARLVTTADAERDGSSTYVFLDPFAHQPVRAVSADGGWFALVQSRAPRLDGLFPQSILMFDAQGDTAWTTEIMVRGAAISEHARRELVGQVAELYPQGVRGRYLKWMEGEDRATFYPPVRAAALDIDGSLWLQLRVSEESTQVVRIGPDGRRPSSVPVPANSILRAVLGRRLWFVTSDEFDVESVVAVRVGG